MQKVLYTAQNARPRVGRAKSALYMYMQVINTFTEAVQTVDIEKAIGKPHTLWVTFAKFYEDNDQVPEVGET